MRICSKCNRQYDDSWKVCMHCGIALVEPSLGEKVPAALLSEISAIRNEISGLNERLNLLEYNLSNTSERTVLEKRVEEFQQRRIEKEKKAQQQPSSVKEAIEKKIQARKGFAENVEQILGEQWFNKLGILAVVIGVALLVGYSFKYLGPAGKIGIGFAFGLGMIIFGHYIERKESFSVYGRGLIGGGWAITYFTTFAMHHISSVRLVASPVLGMAMLLAVAALTVADVYRYKSQAATAFSYLLIFITLMISPVSFYTMAAAVPVAFSLIFFMHRMRWFAFGIYGMIMTYFTYMSWFRIAQVTTKAVMTPEQFFVAAAFLIFYWAIFVFATLLMKDDDKRSMTIGSLDLAFGMEDLIHVLNAIIPSILGSGLLQFGFQKYSMPALVLAAGLYLGLTVATYIMKRRSLCIISSTISVIFTALWLSNKFAGYPLTVSYIILAQVILVAGIFFKESYWRILSFVVSAVVIMKLLVIDCFVVKNTTLGMHLSTRTLLFAFAFVVYLVNYIWYMRLGKRGLLTEVESGYVIAASYFYPLIYAVGTWLDLPKVLTGPCWVILGIVLLQLGVWRNDRHQRIQGHILNVGAFLRLLMSNMLVQGGIAIFSYRMLTCVPVLLLLYYGVMLLSEERTKNILTDRERKMAVVYPYMVFMILMFLIWYEVPKSFVAPLWGIIAVAYSLRGVYSKEKYYLSISSIAALSACARAIFVNLFQGKYLAGPEGSVSFSAITIGALYAGNVFYLRSKEALKQCAGEGEGRIRRFLHSSRLVYGIAATLLLTVLLVVKLQGVLLTVGLGMEGMLLFLCGFWLKDKYWRMFGLVILLATLAKVFLVDLRQLSTIYYILSLIILGAALLFVSYVYTKHKDKIGRLI